MKAEILSRLETKVLGRLLNVFEEAGSTNDLAKERARVGGEEGEAFFALRQTAGRGRLGRVWESPAGKNILMSVILRPSCSPAEASLLPLVAGAATHDLLASYVSGDPETAKTKDIKDLRIKWPNDLYWQDRKVAGILAETESEAGALRFVVCGIGVDVNADEADFSPEVRHLATSLKSILGKTVDLAQATARLLGFLERRYQEFLKGEGDTIIRFCDEHSYLKGRKILFEAPEGKIAGMARGLTPQGHLLVERHDGSVIPVVSGDVTLAVVA